MRRTAAPACAPPNFGGCRRTPKRCLSMVNVAIAIQAKKSHFHKQFLPNRGERILGEARRVVRAIRE